MTVTLCALLLPGLLSLLHMLVRHPNALDGRRVNGESPAGAVLMTWKMLYIADPQNYGECRLEDLPPWRHT